MAKLSPIESEFASTEEGEAYDAWFRAEVQAALDDPSPGISHEEAMTRVRRVIQEARRAAGRLAT